MRWLWGGSLLGAHPEPWLGASRLPSLLSALSAPIDRGAANPAVNAATARLLFSDQPNLAQIMAGNRSRLQNAITLPATTAWPMMTAPPLASYLPYPAKLAGSAGSQ